MAPLPKLLCVDDDAEILDLCRRLFRSSYTVFCENNAQDALELACREKVSVALCDQRMPRMTGVEFFARLNEKNPFCARIVMTGYTDVEEITRLLNRGRLEGFILKPWNNHQLKQTVDREYQNHIKSIEIARLNQKIKNEPTDELDLLMSLDPNFTVPTDNASLKAAKESLRNIVAGEVEKVFLKNLFGHATKTKITDVARSVNINRTFLYRLLGRHGYLEKG